VKCDSVEKNYEIIDFFNINAYRFFSVKMFQLKHQSNNINNHNNNIQQQLTNDQMPEFYCHCECSKCPPPAPTLAFSRFEK